MRISSAKGSTSIVKKQTLLIGLFVLTMWLLGGCDSSPQGDAAPPQTATAQVSHGVIVCMGDSLTAGYGVEEDQAYPALLEERLQEDGLPYSVVNAGISGETSSGALSRLDWMLTLDPDIVILETGANDGLRGVDPALTRRNIEAIVAALQDRGIVVVLAGMKMVRNLGPDFTKAFSAIYPEIARQNDLILMPFFLEGVAGRPGLNQADGIHPTPEGYRIIVGNLYPYVRDAITLQQAK
jgi:acyl-CoA thioesterase I